MGADSLKTDYEVGCEARGECDHVTDFVEL